MKIFTALALIGLMFVFSCSDSEKEQEKKEQTNIGQGINSLSKSSGKVSYQDENTLVFSSKDKKLYPVPERCKRELEQKSANTGGRSMQGGLTISAYTDFWPDNSTPQNPPNPYSAYILESRTYTYVNKTCDYLGIESFIQWGENNNEVIYQDTIYNYNTDYQVFLTRHTKPIPWTGYYHFEHFGEEFIDFGEYDSFEIFDEEIREAVYRYSPYW